jgi:hypothetical protein
MNCDRNNPNPAADCGERAQTSARRGRNAAGSRGLILLLGFAMACSSTVHAGQHQSAPPPPSHSAPPQQHNSAPPPPHSSAPPQQHAAPQPYNVPAQQHNAPQTYNPPPQSYNAPHYAPPSVPPKSQSQYPARVQQQHLGDWLQTHQHLAPAEQQKALQQEPGFNKLPPAQQQRLITRLQDLNNKSPEQRQRTIDRVETWERMSPAQKQQVANSTAQLRSMPPDRQLPLRRAFRDLRDMPPEQRQQILNSSRFQGEFSSQERGILSNLLTVEPYQANRPMPANPSQTPPSTVPIPAYR